MKKDASGYNAIGLAPKGIESIAADTEIEHLAIMAESDIEIYFNGDAYTTFVYPGGYELIVSEGLRLVTTTTCLVY